MHTVSSLFSQLGYASWYRTNEQEQNILLGEQGHMGISSSLTRATRFSRIKTGILWSLDQTINHTPLDGVTLKTPRPRGWVASARACGQKAGLESYLG